MAPSLLPPGVTGAATYAWLRRQGAGAVCGWAQLRWRCAGGCVGLELGWSWRHLRLALGELQLLLPPADGLLGVGEEGEVGAAVVAHRWDQAPNRVAIFANYDIDPSASRFERAPRSAAVWEAARATSAADTFRRLPASEPQSANSDVAAASTKRPTPGIAHAVGMKYRGSTRLTSETNGGAAAFTPPWRTWRRMRISRSRGLVSARLDLRP